MNIKGKTKIGGSIMYDKKLLKKKHAVLLDEIVERYTPDINFFFLSLSFKEAQFGMRQPIDLLTVCPKLGRVSEKEIYLWIHTLYCNMN
jgi:hypothetical protein